MSRIVVLVPSRGRPERARAMYRSAMDNAVGPRGGTEVLLIVDADDPALPGYASHQLPLRVLEEQVGYTASLNAVARELWDSVDILGAFGDDVLFRTPGWDRIVEVALQTPAIAYGDDLIHGRNHPSAVWMHSTIAKALGWLALPSTTHQWADDGWKRLGQELGLLRFLPEVVVEHMHPAVGKADWDATYEGVFQSERAKGDYEGFTAWAENGGLAADAVKVRAALAVPA
jgi:hypothetical protein